MSCYCRNCGSADEPLRVLELYSGVGGMHFALNAAIDRFNSCDTSEKPWRLDFHVTAVDISPPAKTVYDRNFPESSSLQLDIRALPADAFENLYLLTMSPPCQPFSRNGNFKDVDDDRCESFIFVMDRLARACSPPRLIVMENVKGFEVSRARHRLLRILLHRKYSVQEYLLSPVDFGIPNSRLRYYLTGRLSAHTEPLPEDFVCQAVEGDIPFCPAQIPDIEAESPCQTIQDFLSLRGENVLINEELLVPSNVLERYLMAMDVKHPLSTTTNCFTSGYGRFVRGTGSVFCPLSREKFDVICADLALTKDEEVRQNLLTNSNMRFFHPLEVARFMGFPPRFVFPVKLPTRKAWQLIGNSLNVHLVSKLMAKLLSEDTKLCTKNSE